MASSAAAPTDAAQPLCPELDEACIATIARHTAAEDFRSLLLICRRWRGAASDPALPFWAELDARRWALLGPELPFCACQIARAARRLSHVLTRLDLRDAVACPRCPRAPAEGDAACTQALWAELLGRPWPRLRLLDASATRRGRAAPPSDAAFQAAAPGLWPQLHTLRLAGCELDGSCLEALWRLAPALQELGLARNEDLLEAHVAALARRAGQQRLPLRLNLLDEEPTPPVHVACGVCGERLWSRLASYCRAPRSQAHIEVEYYVNAAPEAELSPLRGATAMLNCSSRCHERSQLYLVDAGSGNVEMHGWRFAVAVGEGRPGRLWLPAARAVPPLARVQACQP